MSLSVPVCLKMTSLTPFCQPKKYSRPTLKAVSATGELVPGQEKLPLGISLCLPAVQEH